jgi:hypothetical protein
LCQGGERDLAGGGVDEVGQPIMVDTIGSASRP